MLSLARPFQKLKNLIGNFRSLKKILPFTNLSQLSPAQLAYLRDLRLESVVSMNRSHAIVMVPGYVLSSIASATLLSESLRLVISLSFMVMATYTGIWFLLEPYAKKTRSFFVAQIYFFISFFLATLIFSICLSYMIKDPSMGISEYFSLGLIWMVYLLHIEIGAPIVDRFAPIFFVAGVTITVVVFSMAGVPEAHSTVSILLVSSLFQLLFMVITHHRDQKHALIGFANAELVRENNLLKIKQVEGELHVARALQEAMTALSESVNHQSLKLHAHYLPYGILGGDWAAARVLSNGRVVIAIGDVTGKGVPAALVVQAVHSLWVAALNHENFDTRGWLDSVNRTLLALGSGSSQTMTLGIAEIDGNVFHYYSAGHVPCYLFADATDVKSGVTLTGAGTPLGLTDVLKISKFTYTTMASGEYKLILATDGIFDMATRKKMTRVFEVAAQAAYHGDAWLRQHPVDDDKILIVVDGSFAGQVHQYD